MDVIRGGYIIGSIDGRVRGSASLVPGKQVNALSLDGINGRVYYGKYFNECFHLPEMCTTGSTFSYWLRYRNPNTGDSHGCILDTGGMYHSSHGYTLRILYPATLGATVIDVANYYVTIANIDNPFDWLFIVHTWSPSTGINIYLNGCIMNGQMKAMFGRTQKLRLSFPFKIGEKVYGDRQRAEMDLDNLMAWDNELTAEEVWQLYVQAGHVPVPEWFLNLGIHRPRY